MIYLSTANIATLLSQKRNRGKVNIAGNIKERLGYYDLSILSISSRSERKLLSTS